MDDSFTDALKRLLADQCTPQFVRAIEAGASAAGLWAHLEASGFADALLLEDDGGAGLTLPDVFGLLELCGQYAVPVPLSHTMLALALLASAGVPRPQGSIAIAIAAGLLGSLVQSETVHVQPRGPHEMPAVAHLCYPPP